MVKSNQTQFIETHKSKNWPYADYYIGNKDPSHRRCGKGANHWTGAEGIFERHHILAGEWTILYPFHNTILVGSEYIPILAPTVIDHTDFSKRIIQCLESRIKGSLERYTGGFLLNTMHGRGEYRWRHYRENGSSTTYEGYFYANIMHGYGTISYDDGRVFTGLLYNNFRWGPGIETHVCLSENVGLWCGNKLIRLAWSPNTTPVVPNLTSTPMGLSLVKEHRITLTSNFNKIGEINSAIDMLKQSGADPQIADERWRILYPLDCTDVESALFYRTIFQHSFYHGQTNTLTETSRLGSTNVDDNDPAPSENTTDDVKVYYAWNNSRSAVAMMKHSFKHEFQRPHESINLENILTGQRRKFKPAAEHELNCRTLIMASYLGNVPTVAHLINNENVHPDIADFLGNTALIYAVSGNKVETIRFLVDAGARVNIVNDSCCTPLAIALIYYVATELNVPLINAMKAVVPAEPVQKTDFEEDKIIEWNMNRAIAPIIAPITPKSATKLASSRKMNSVPLMKSASVLKKKSVLHSKTVDNFDSNNALCDTDRHLYNLTTYEYQVRVIDAFATIPVAIVQSIFQCNSIQQSIEDYMTMQNEKPSDKNPKKVSSKIVKPNPKTSKEVLWQNTVNSPDNNEILKQESLTKIQLTIEELLLAGAKPGDVRCPLPAIAMAIAAKSVYLTRILLEYDADPNERYPEMMNYTPLELAISGPMTSENFNIIVNLLERGSKANQRLRYETPNDDTQLLGPTLLHAVLAKRTENESETDIQRQLLDILLEYGSDALCQYKGQSSIDLSLTQNREMLDTFIKSPNVDLNAEINDNNETILVKLFNFNFFRTIDHTENITTLTNLLLLGADPLLTCQNENGTYTNLFTYANEQLSECEQVSFPSSVKSLAKKSEAKVGKGNKSGDKGDPKGQSKVSAEDKDDYKQALELVCDCSRLIHIRWLQAALVKDLINIINKFKHRHWSMIMKEHKRKKETAIWITPQRSLEIWDVLKSSKKKFYEDKAVLKALLHITYYYNLKDNLSKKLNGEEKDIVESYVNNLLREYQSTSTTSEDIPWKLNYVKPELNNNKEKYQICFECLKPLTETKISCHKCKLVFFCSQECIGVNVARSNCHPCRLFMKEKYFPSVDDLSIPIDI